MKYIIAPKEYTEPEKIEGCEPSPASCRVIVAAMLVFWAIIIGTVALLWSCQAEAARQVYLESEQDLGNGYKLCVYSEGVTITRPSHTLCPLSVEV